MLSQAKLWFDEALAIDDSVERSQALCDLAFYAEQMVSGGKREEAIELFELLATLDRYDDLLHPAIESADKHLVTLGVRSQPSLDDVVSQQYVRFDSLPEREKMLAVATVLGRDYRNRAGALTRATELLESAHTLRPLSGSELRLRAELLQRAKQVAAPDGC